MAATLFLVMIIGNSWIPFVEANLTLNQSLNHHRVCDSHCSIENLPAMKKGFERQTSERARVINLKVQLLHYNSSGLCQNDSLRERQISNSSMLWVVDKTQQPRLHFGLYAFWKLVVRLNCITRIEIEPSADLGTSLYDAVIRNLVKDLGRSTGGTLCFPWESESNVVMYKCCNVDEFSSVEDCEVHHPSSASLRMFQGLFVTLACVILPLYLPAAICLFPYPKVSEEGISCIKLDDPSPAGIRGLVVKAFVPQNKNSVMSCVRIMLLRVIFIPCLVCLPIILQDHVAPSSMMSDISSPVFIILYCGYVLESLMAIFWPKPQKPCKYCKILFSESVIHSTLAEKVKAHLSVQLYFCVKCCRLFSFYYLNLLKKHLGFRLELSTSWAECLCKALYFTAALFPALLGIIAGNGFVLLLSFLATCPIFNLNHYDQMPNYYRRILQYRCRHFEQDIVYCFSRTAERIVLGLSTTAVGLLFFLSAFVSAQMLVTGILLIINNAKVLFPYLAMAVLTAYYLWGCFSLFTEKYQLLKIKLYQSCKKYQQLKESSELIPRETKLILYTKDNDIAIPEDLYEVAIQKLRIPIMRNLWMALLKMFGVLIAAIFIFNAIMIISTHAGTAPLTQTVFVFLAGSLPKMFSIFTFGESKQKLEELNMEELLDDVIVQYAHNQMRLCNHTRGSIIESTDTDVKDTEMEECSEYTSEIRIELLDGVEENDTGVE